MTGLRQRRLIASFLVLVFITSVFAPLMPKAEAKVYLVIDWDNLLKAKAILNQLKAQLEALEKMKQHLEKIGLGFFNNSKKYILDAISKLTDLRNKAKGLSYDINKTEEVWKKTYKQQEDFMKMSGAEYAEFLKNLDQRTSDALFDAMKAQSLISELDGDKDELEKLMQKSYDSVGTLQALQVGNQIQALQMNQLLRMQTIMAMSYRAQTMYYQWEMQEKMSQRIYAEKNQIQLGDPTQNVSSMGFPSF